LLLHSLTSDLRGINLVEILPLALILLVSSVPVALPTMFTVTMALGSQELAKKGVLVTRLDASQDASMMDILCADKTGTITSNKLSVAEVTAFDGYTKEDVILFGALASSEANQDPIDIAFLEAARQKGLDKGDFVQVDFTPFDPSSRRTESTVQKNNDRIRVTKGAVKTLAALCGDFVMTFLISYFGIPGLVPIPAEYILIAIIWYLTFALIVNDIVKVNILRH
jgi:H+-transporting ATPase